MTQEHKTSPDIFFSREALKKTFEQNIQAIHLNAEAFTSITDALGIEESGLNLLIHSSNEHFDSLLCTTDSIHLYPSGKDIESVCKEAILQTLPSELRTRGVIPIILPRWEYPSHITEMVAAGLEKGVTYSETNIRRLALPIETMLKKLQTPNLHSENGNGVRELGRYDAIKAITNDAAIAAPPLVPIFHPVRSRSAYVRNTLFSTL